MADYGEARRTFERARDEDICPLRATGPLIDAVRSVAENDDVQLIDFVHELDE